METPIWELAGLSMSDYRRLPWPIKRTLIIRHRGIYIQDSCFGCGKTERRMREEYVRSTMAPELRDHPYGHLIWAWRKQKAAEEWTK